MTPEERHKKASEYLEMGIDLWMEMDLWMGVGQVGKYNFQAGIKAWEGASPSEPDHRYILAQCHLKLGVILKNPEERINAWQAGIKAWEGALPSEPKHRDTLAGLHLNLGRILKNPEERINAYQAGIKAWEGALPSEPDHRDILAMLHFNLGVILPDQRKREWAISFSLCAIPPLSPSLFYTGWLCCDQVIFHEISFSCPRGQNPRIDQYLTSTKKAHFHLNPDLCRKQMDIWIEEILERELSELPYIKSLGKEFSQFKQKSLALSCIQRLLESFLTLEEDEKEHETRDILSLLRTLEEIPAVPLHRMEMGFLTGTLFPPIVSVVESADDAKNLPEILLSSLSILQRILDRAYDEDDPSSFSPFAPLVKIYQSFAEKALHSIETEEEKVSELEKAEIQISGYLYQMYLCVANNQLLQSFCPEFSSENLLDSWFSELKKMESRMEVSTWDVGERLQKQLREYYGFLEVMLDQAVRLPGPKKLPESFQREYYNLLLGLMERLKEYEIRKSSSGAGLIDRLFGKKTLRSSARPGVQEIRNILREDEVFLHLAYTASNIFWLVIPKEGLPEVISLPLEKSEKSSSPSEESLREIADVLGLFRLVPYMEDKKWLISPYGQTNQILFPALPYQEKPLGISVAIEIVPNGTLLVKRRSPEESAAEDSTPVFEKGLLNCEGFSDKAITNLANQFSKSPPPVLLDRSNFPEALQNKSLFVSFGHSCERGFFLYGSSSPEKGGNSFHREPSSQNTPVIKEGTVDYWLGMALGRLLNQIKNKQESLDTCCFSLRVPSLFRRRRTPGGHLDCPELLERP